jgi:alkylation response protein AidB-like acyl-CoA dehydrogenase
VSLLDAARGLRDQIRARATDIERERRLPPELVDALTSIGTFRAGVPAALGGPQVPILEQLLCFEELARADAAVGWCAMIGAQTSATSASLDPDEAKSIFGDPSVRVAGVFAPSGHAVVDGGTVRLSGRWAFGSGVTHSHWFALGAVVFDGDEPRMVNDRPDLRFVYVPVSELEIEDTWHVSGLRGTGSNHVVADDVVVPASRTFPLFGARPHHPGALFLLPLGSLAIGLGAVAMGIARDAIEEFDSLAAGKTPTGASRPLAMRSHVQMERATAEAELRAARALLYDTVTDVWDRVDRGERLSTEHRAAIRLASTHAVRTSARVVDRVYDLGGGTSILETSRLQRCFRDVHAVTQHLITAPPTLELVGRVLLGVETDTSQL